MSAAQPPAGAARAVVPAQRAAGEDHAGVPDDVVDLVDRARAGDRRAFGALYERHLDLVYRFIYFRVRDRQVAEDLTSETFCRALKGVDGFTWQGRDIGAWFVTIARNMVADHFKSARVRLVTNGLEMDIDPEADPDERPDELVPRRLSGAAAARALRAAIAQLTEHQQDVIGLRFVQNLSVADTAAALGLEVGAVKALQYRAVRTLARLVPHLDPHGEAQP